MIIFFPLTFPTFLLRMINVWLSTIPLISAPPVISFFCFRIFFNIIIAHRNYSERHFALGERREGAIHGGMSSEAGESMSSFTLPSAPQEQNLLGVLSEFCWYLCPPVSMGRECSSYVDDVSFRYITFGYPYACGHTISVSVQVYVYMSFQPTFSTLST